LDLRRDDEVRFVDDPDAVHRERDQHSAVVDPMPGRNANLGSHAHAIFESPDIGHGHLRVAEAFVADEILRHGQRQIAVSLEIGR